MAGKGILFRTKGDRPLVEVSSVWSGPFQARIVPTTYLPCPSKLEERSGRRCVIGRLRASSFGSRLLATAAVA